MATKSVVLRLRVSEGARADIRVAAEAAGLPVSEWLRRVALKAAGEGLPVQSSGEYREWLDLSAPRAASYSERFVVPASCPAPNTKKSFKPDFK